MSQRFEGRNLEEALQSASATLGVERWQLTYHVLLEKRGFLGGVKRVVIEADVNVEAPPPTPAPAVASAVAPAAPAPLETRAPRSADRDRGPRRGGARGGGGGGGRARGGERGGRGGNGESRGGRGRGGNRSHQDELQPGDFEAFFGDVPEQGPESDAARAVHEWCERVVSLSRLALAVRTEEREEQIIVRLYGSDTSKLVDRHGELLDAIQVLANKALVGRKVEKEVELDCETFKEQRIEQLGARAREVADRVRSGGREELLPAMTPIERRIVHLALRDDADVTTESRGDGFYKRVAIIPRPPGEPAAEPSSEP